MTMKNDWESIDASSGILRPKLSNKFMVYTSVTMPANSKVSGDQANALIRGISSQAVSVELPTELFTAPHVRGPLKENFIPIAFTGLLKLTLEDDITNVASRAVEFLASASSIQVLVMKVDGNEHAVEAFLFGGVQLLSYSHGSLSYETGRAIYRALVSDPKWMQKWRGSMKATDLANKALGVF
jgi:hypothetical protein